MTDSTIIYGKEGDNRDGPYDYENAWYIILNPLYFPIGHMCVYADAPHDDTETPDESDPDDFTQEIISLEVELQLEASLQFVNE